MAYSLQDTTDLTSLGNAIRAKTGGSSNMTVAEMATAVAGISSGGGSLQELRFGRTSSSAVKGPVTVSVDTLPSKFILIYTVANGSSSGSDFTIYTVIYDNGTTTTITYCIGGVISNGGATITQSNGTTNISVGTSSVYLWPNRDGTKSLFRAYYAG